MARPWKVSEDRILISTVKEYLTQGIDLDEAFRVASESTGRTVRACSDRWRTLYKNRKTKFEYRPIDWMTPVPNEEQTKMFDQFIQSFEWVKQETVKLQEQSARLTEENEELKQRVRDLEAIEEKYNALLGLLDEHRAKVG